LRAGRKDGADLGADLVAVGVVGDVAPHGPTAIGGACAAQVSR
jgi:hypothetical protein